MDETVKIGIILRPFGLKGTIKVKSLTSFPADRFKKGKKVLLHRSREEEYQTFTISEVRFKDEEIYLTFKEINDLTTAEKLRNASIELEKSEARLPEGYYRLGDLIGLKALNSSSEEELGLVSDLLDYAPTKTLQITMNNGKRFYVPFINETFIREIDLEKKIVKINVIEGLLP